MVVSRKKKIQQMYIFKRMSCLLILPHPLWVTASCKNIWIVFFTCLPLYSTYCKYCKLSHSTLQKIFKKSQKYKNFKAEKSVGSPIMPSTHSTFPEIRGLINKYGYIIWRPFIFKVQGVIPNELIDFSDTIQNYKIDRKSGCRIIN